MWEARAAKSSQGGGNFFRPLAPEDLSALSGLLDAALEIGESDRERWLEALPYHQRSLTALLREMLVAKSCPKGGGLLSELPLFVARGNGDAVARAGQFAGPYRLVREIGRGGMGVVWLAEGKDGDFQRQVALKFPNQPDVLSCCESFAREAEIGALLNHPNIARLYDTGYDEGGRPFMAMEYVDGVPIDAWCRRDFNMTVRDRLLLIAKVTRTVGYIHARSIIHCDLKPSNILVMADAQVRVLDFGIARTLLSKESAHQGQRRMLTRHYASPEQLLGAVATFQSDVYSLGVLAYELLTGSHPHGPKSISLGPNEERGSLATPSTRAPTRTDARQLCGALAAIVIRALSVDPAGRYANASMLADDIERHLALSCVSLDADLERAALFGRRHDVLKARKSVARSDCVCPFSSPLSV